MKYVREAKIPDTNTELVKASLGFWSRLFGGEERKFIIVENEKEHLMDFFFYIGARNFGNNLDISWYLTCEPGLFKEAFGKGSFDLNVFQSQDLSAYVTCVHHCVLKAVEDTMTAVGQDFSKIDKKSKGFLGIS